MQKSFNLIPLLFLLVFTVSSHAQSVGPKVGINIASWAGDDQFDDDFFTSNTVFQFGAVAELPLTDQLSLQPELLFFQKGFGTETSFLGVTSTTDNRLNYLEIPVLGKFFLTDGPTQIFVTAGPSFGFGLGGKAIRESGGDTEEVDIDFEEDELSVLDLSLSIGAGAQAEVGPGKVFVDIRYLMGLTNVDDAPENEQIDIFNRGIGIAAGFLFPIGQ